MKQRFALNTMAADTPLGHCINELLGTQEMIRRRRLANLFDSFHLKHTVTTAVNGRIAEINGREVINFGSANYLGFDQDPRIIEAAIMGLKKWGNHAGCSRIFSTQENLLQLEKELAALVGAEDCLVGLNVSMIHQTVVPTLFSQRNFDLLIDRFAHTSMYQAALAAKAKGARLISVDIADKEDLLKKISSGDHIKVLFIDGIYSMQGHCPDLQELQSICLEHQTILYVDDAHGIGILGDRGGGVAEKFGLDFSNLILVGSLQKGLGCHGGFVAGHHSLINSLKALAKSYIFTGPPQSQAIDASLEAVRLCQSEEGRRRRRYLHNWSIKIREELRRVGFDVTNSDSPIVAIPIGGDVRTLMAGRKLFDLGVFVNSVIFPAVPRGEGILRISLSSLHTPRDFRILLDAFIKLKEYLDGNLGPLREPLHYAWSIIAAKLQGDHYAGL